MDSQNVASLATLIGAVASVLSILTGFILSKRKNRRESDAVERQQLSADQQDFITNLKAENETLRDRFDKLSAEFFTLKEQAVRDRIRYEKRIAELERRLNEGTETE